MPKTINVYRLIKIIILVCMNISLYILIATMKHKIMDTYSNKINKCMFFFFF